MSDRPVAFLADVERPSSPAERREWVHAYRAYLRGGADAWDRYDQLRAEGHQPGMALALATTARVVV
jgi:hypothetical protein